MSTPKFNLDDLAARARALLNGTEARTVQKALDGDEDDADRLDPRAEGSTTGQETVDGAKKEMADGAAAGAAQGGEGGSDAGPDGGGNDGEGVQGDDDGSTDSDSDDYDEDGNMDVDSRELRKAFGLWAEEMDPGEIIEGNPSIGALLQAFMKEIRGKFSVVEQIKKKLAEIEASVSEATRETKKSLDVEALETRVSVLQKTIENLHKTAPAADARAFTKAIETETKTPTEISRAELTELAWAGKLSPLDAASLNRMVNH